MTKAEQNDRKTSNPEEGDPPGSDVSSSSRPSRHDDNDITQAVGQSAAQLSDFVNNNLIIIRYGTVATIGVLAAYGLSQTPLFFRYRRTADIPGQLFVRRKSIKARLVKVAGTGQGGKILTPEHSIQLYVRHLSLMERLLSQPLYNRVMQLGSRRRDEDDEQLLCCEMAGIIAPPAGSGQAHERTASWLGQMARQRTLVTCQLLARRVQVNKDASTNGSGFQRLKREIPGFETTKKSEDFDQSNQVAICKMFFRPHWTNLLATDMAEHLVRTGRASVNHDDGLRAAASSTRSAERTVDATDAVPVLRADAKYLDDLSRVELQAAHGRYGMWADVGVREQRRDVTDEVDFRERASWWQKFRRWMQGG